jgi:hypothetical protein
LLSVYSVVSRFSQIICSADQAAVSALVDENSLVDQEGQQQACSPVG